MAHSVSISTAAQLHPAEDAAAIRARSRRAGYDPFFAYGYGLTYGDHVTAPHLNETPPAEGPLNLTSYYTPSKVTLPLKLETEDAVTSTAVDSETKQEGALRYTFTGQGRTAQPAGRLPVDAKLGRRSNARR